MFGLATLTVTSTLQPIWDSYRKFLIQRIIDIQLGFIGINGSCFQVAINMQATLYGWNSNNNKLSSHCVLPFRCTPQYSKLSTHHLPRFFNIIYIHRSFVYSRCAKDTSKKQATFWLLGRVPLIFVIYHIIASLIIVARSHPLRTLHCSNQFRQPQPHRNE